MKNFLKKLIKITILNSLFILPVYAAMPESGGISIDSSRIIFNENSRNEQLTITNRSNTPYMIYVVIKKNKNENVPFIATPQVFNLQANSSNSIKIIPTEKVMLDEERESLFYITLLAIQGQKQKIIQNDKLSVGIRLHIKMLYRPKNLSNTSESMYCSLKFSTKNSVLRVENPSPYYMTFNYLKIDNQTVDFNKNISMIPPMGHQNYPISAKAQRVEWQLINDYGGLSSICKSN